MALSAAKEQHRVAKDLVARFGATSVALHGDASAVAGQATDPQTPTPLNLLPEDILQHTKDNKLGPLLHELVIMVEKVGLTSSTSCFEVSALISRFFFDFIPTPASQAAAAWPGFDALKS